MEQSVVLLQPAYILQHRKYRESSLILDVLTRDFGIVSILARGVRKSRSKTAGLLLAFSALNISYMGKNTLKILTHVELVSRSIKLTGLSLYCSFYINELVSYFLHKHDPHPEVFDEYQRCLLRLSQSNNIEQVLRFFELDLLEMIGYGLSLRYRADTGDLVLLSNKYYFEGEVGLLESSKGYITGETLLALGARQSLNKKALAEAKQLMRHVIDFQLHGKRLKSRAVLAKIMKQL